MQKAKRCRNQGNVLDPIDLIDGISLEDLQKTDRHSDAAANARENYKHNQAAVPDGLQSYGTDALPLYVLLSRVNRQRHQL